ncbi:hypothetical protein Pflav_076040 [Phytohabitans flavus]|uniref:Uncharacterized protein n=1 Tax=Phytohabitans flavus TaxID=1076124 RepID=A0A6F8Y4Z0_9ACTN|nr:hypothetical protein [Phytohabitans flavus]BCB81194.1 hypothetical protein Pflav_076040 [Phytohabitans flavus]
MKVLTDTADADLKLQRHVVVSTTGIPAVLCRFADEHGQRVERRCTQLPGDALGSRRTLWRKLL